MTGIQRKAKTNTPEGQLSFPSLEKLSWKKKKFSEPKHVINVATLFSGIGAIEQALKRLKLKHRIVFAGDIDKNCKASYFANYKILLNKMFIFLDSYKNQDYCIKEFDPKLSN